MCLSLTVRPSTPPLPAAAWKTHLKGKWTSAREGQHVGAPSSKHSLQQTVSRVRFFHTYFFHVGRAASQNKRDTELEIRDDGRSLELECLPWAAALQSQQRRKRKNKTLHCAGRRRRFIIHTVLLPESVKVGEKRAFWRIQSLSSVFLGLRARLQGEHFLGHCGRFAQIQK